MGVQAGLVCESVGLGASGALWHAESGVMLWVGGGRGEVRGGIVLISRMPYGSASERERERQGRRGREDRDKLGEWGHQAPGPRPAERQSDISDNMVTNTGYSSVGRASDCRHMQISDGPWFDSGWPELSGDVEIKGVLA